VVFVDLLLAYVCIVCSRSFKPSSTRGGCRVY